MKATKLVISAAAILAAAGTAQAQWVINELQTDSSGSPDSQFVELYNPTADASVSGLTLINIRASQARAVSAIDLTGTATGNYYVVGNAQFDTSFPSVADALLTLSFRASYCQTILVNTADLPVGFTADPTTGYVFTGTEFSSGSQLVDSVMFMDATDPVLWSSQTALVDLAGGPWGAERVPDGASWQAFAQIGTAPGLDLDATPDAANIPASIDDWMVY